MQPGVAGGFCSERKQRVVPIFRFAAAEAAAGRRAHRIAVQPFGHESGKGACLGLGALEPAIELRDSGPLVEEHLPARFQMDPLPAHDFTSKICPRAARNQASLESSDWVMTSRV
jgi:hypothetical protein